MEQFVRNMKIMDPGFVTVLLDLLGHYVKDRYARLIPVDTEVLAWEVTLDLVSYAYAQLDAGALYVKMVCSKILVLFFSTLGK